MRKEYITPQVETFQVNINRIMAASAPEITFSATDETIDAGEIDAKVTVGEHHSLWED